MNEKLHRRRFLGAAGSVTAALLAAGASAHTDSQICCGVIGIGRRGTHLLRLLLGLPDVRVTAVCDVQAAHLERGRDMVAEAGQPKPPGFGAKGPQDYRR